MKYSNAVGVDVSDSSIKVLKLDQEGNIIAYGNDTLHEGIVVDGRIIDTDAFAAKLNDILKRTRPQVLYSEKGVLRSVLCLPESKLFTHYLSVPNTLREADLDAYVREDAQKIIPFELDDMYWDYHIAKKRGVRNATFLGVAKQDLDNYVEAFTHARVKPAFVGGELFSLGSALLPNSSLEEGYLIVDFGKHTTTIGIFGDDAIPNVSIKVGVGGDYLTRMLSEKLGIPEGEAEDQKRRFGLDVQFEQTRVPGVLRECVSKIVSEINEAKAYFEKKTGNPIRHIIIAGGSALLPKLDSYIREQTGTEARVADPLTKIKNHEFFERETPGILFANVIGLALHATHTHPLRINLLTQYRYEEGDAEKQPFNIRDVRSVSDLAYVSYSFLKRLTDLMVPLKRYAGGLKRIHIRLVLVALFLLAALISLVLVVKTYI